MSKGFLFKQEMFNFLKNFKCNVRIEEEEVGGLKIFKKNSNFYQVAQQ